MSRDITNFLDESKWEEISNHLSQASKRFELNNFTWCIFAGAAARCYGASRPITDIDLLVRLASDDDLQRMFPRGTLVKKSVLMLGPLDIQSRDLSFRADSRQHVWTFDSQAIEHLTMLSFFGVLVPVMSAEDVIVTKCILQRGMEVGKHDLEDVCAVIAARKQQLDRSYLRYRAAKCDAIKRVARCLEQFEINL